MRLASKPAVKKRADMTGLQRWLYDELILPALFEVGARILRAYPWRRCPRGTFWLFHGWGCWPNKCGEP